MKEEEEVKSLEALRLPDFDFDDDALVFLQQPQLPSGTPPN